MKKEKEVLNTVKSSKIQYLGHIMRNESRFHLLQAILQGKVFGRKGVGRRRISWLKNLRNWFAMNPTQLFRAAVNKVMIVMMPTSGTDRNYKKKKLIKRSYKLWVCADRSGYVCEFQIYTGKTGNSTQKSLGA